MCPINSVIHAYMHIHVHCQKLTDLPDRNNDFFMLVTSLFDIPFEEGNSKIGQFILEKKLYSSEKNGQVDCFSHIELVLDKLELPTSNVLCYVCGWNQEFA